MSSPFACNAKQSLFGKNKIDNQVKPEPVTLVADKSQVITAIIPFSTKMASKIREHMHEYVRNDEGQKIFIFRQVNGWTNISLEATEDNPKLTEDPIKTLIKAWTEFNRCPSVSKVDIKWTGSDTVLGYDDIPLMEDQFEALPVKEHVSDDVGTSNKTDAEILYEHLSSLHGKVDALDVKMKHMIHCIEKLAGNEDEAESIAGESSTPAIEPDQTFQKPRKRGKARA
jgi:hypothetical protein